jgi:hypothetical protein
MKATKKTRTKKPKLVDRKFLLDVANLIYDPKQKNVPQTMQGKAYERA